MFRSIDAISKHWQMIVWWVIYMSFNYLPGFKKRILSKFISRISCSIFHSGQSRVFNFQNPGLHGQPAPILHIFEDFCEIVPVCFAYTFSKQNIFGDIDVNRDISTYFWDICGHGSDKG